MTSPEKSAKWRGLLLAACAERPQLLPHTAVEGLRAANVAALLNLSLVECTLVECGALIHDIGKTVRHARTGFHPLDGAVFVSENGGSDPLAALVAWHSSAEYEAQELGVKIPYKREISLASRIIDVVDATTNQQGMRVTIEERTRDIELRYSSESATVKAWHQFLPELRESQEIVCAALGVDELM